MRRGAELDGSGDGFDDAVGEDDLLTCPTRVGFQADAVVAGDDQAVGDEHVAARYGINAVGVGVIKIIEDRETAEAQPVAAPEMECPKIRIADREVAHSDIATVAKHHHADAELRPWLLLAALAAAEISFADPADGAGTFDRDGFLIVGDEKVAHVFLFGRFATAETGRLAMAAGRVVVLAAAGLQHGAVFEPKCHVAAETEHAGEIVARLHEYRAAAGSRARVDRGLNSGRVVGGGIGLHAVVAHIVSGGTHHCER